MALLQWEKRFEIGMPEIDLQHQHIIEMVASVMVLLQETDQNRDINDLVQELVSYTQYHFGTEEVWMIEQNYPGYAQHKAEHKALLKSVSAFAERFDKNNTAGITDALHGFLNAWLMTHLMETDFKMGEFYKNHMQAAK